MYLKSFTDIFNKKGSYITEAGLTLPAFILAVIALSLIINIISICEGICFYSVESIHETDVQAYYGDNALLVKSRITGNVLKNNEKLSSFKMNRLNYLYDANGISELIACDMTADFSVDNPIGILGKIEFKEKILSRAFNGADNKSQTLSIEEFKNGSDSSKVMIFPRYGEKYHKSNCSIVSRDNGENSYHIEMEKEDAERKGYSACLLCGG